MMLRIHDVNKRWRLPILLFISSALVLAACSSKASPARTDPAGLQVSAQRIQDDIVHISTSFPERLAGSDLERNTAFFVRERFGQLGLETAEQEFPIHRYEYSEPLFVWWESTEDSVHLSTQSQAVIDARGSGPALDTMAVRPFLYSPSARPDGSEGELVYCQLGRVSDLKSVDVRGIIALIQRGDIIFTEKALNAQRAGAIGALMFNHADDSMIGTLVQPIWTVLTLPEPTTMHQAWQP